MYFFFKDIDGQLVSLLDRSSLVDYCQDLLSEDRVQVTPDSLVITQVSDRRDKHTGWRKTYLVCVDVYGEVGYCNRIPE